MALLGVQVGTRDAAVQHLRDGTKMLVLSDYVQIKCPWQLILQHDTERHFDDSTSTLVCIDSALLDVMLPGETMYSDTRAARPVSD